MVWSKRLTALLALSGICGAGPLAAQPDSPATLDPPHGVILMYHHVADDTPASTSVSPARFAQHLAFIEAQGYEVWPLLPLLHALRSGKVLSRKAVAITFDDASRSLVTNALPLLHERGWPYTLFVHTQPVSAGSKAHMNWEELAQAVRNGATIGNHSHSHGHLTRLRPDEARAAWRARTIADLDRATALIKDALSVTPGVFAYPYGEFDRETRAIVADSQWFGLGQHSGAVASYSDFHALPRFALGGVYADMDRLALALESRPLPVTRVTLDAAHTMRFSVDPTLAAGAYDAGRPACFASGLGAMALEREGPNAWRATPSGAPAPGRVRYNCTAPAVSGGFYWWSHQLMVPKADGSWYEN